MTRRVTPPNKTERFCGNCRTWKPREMIASAKWCNGNRQVRYTCAECARRIASRQKDHAG